LQKEAAIDETLSKISTLAVKSSREVDVDVFAGSVLSGSRYVAVCRMTDVLTNSTADGPDGGGGGDGDVSSGGAGEVSSGGAGDVSSGGAGIVSGGGPGGGGGVGK